MGYRYEERSGFSDLLFEADGSDLEEVFASSWEAAAHATAENLETVENQRQRRILLEEDELEFLLYDFLGEFVYWRDTEGLILRVQSIDISNDEGTWKLQAQMYGEPLDPQKHGTGVDIKAVTLHEFSLHQDQDGLWRARVIMDI